MSLIRQVWLMLMLTLAAAFIGSAVVSIGSARQYLETQLSQKNNDAAQSMALSMSQQHGELTAIELALSSQFDTGNYMRIELLDPQGRTRVLRRVDAHIGTAPVWFEDLLRIAPAPGIAQVADGWRQIGTLHVLSRLDFAYDSLWRSSWVILGWLALVALAIGAVAAAAVQRIRRPLDAVVGQAVALSERRFVTLSEPDVPELRNVTRAMNGMVARLKILFDEQSVQVDQLRRQANCDALTGIANRAHFMSRLKVALGSEDGAAAGALMLIRLTELQSLNRELGHAATDRLLQDAAAAIIDAGRRASALEVGRLNGSDFAVILPEVGSLREPAIDVAARLRSLLKARGGDASVVLGAVRWWHGAPMSSLLAAADQALARAEGRGPFAVEIDDTAEGLVLGEEAWRESMDRALLEQGWQLIEFPLVDVNGLVVHLECPLRMRVGEGRPWLPAAQWLPMARRVQYTGRIDLVAVDQALQRLARDGLARAVNLSPASLSDAAFFPGLRALLDAHRDIAAGLWLEVAEQGALRQVTLLHELVALAHAHGTKVGLEHAGDGLTQGGAWLESGLDFVKLDAAFVDGLAADVARRQHVAGHVRMLHGIGIRVYAEGVEDVQDARVLWDCEIDGITGPFVQAKV
jgi:diguanylate cyclase (GGDEF)-like protein